MENLEYETVIDGLDEIEIENTSIDEIDSENINLIFLGIDQSGSMYSYNNDMKRALLEFKDALIHSKEADEILIARANFSSGIEIGGYKKIDEFLGDYIAIAVSDKGIKMGTYLSNEMKKQEEKKSSHCGLTENEMRVPVIVFDLKK